LDDLVEDDDLDKPDTKDLSHGEDVEFFGEGFVFSGNEGTVPPPKP